MKTIRQTVTFKAAPEDVYELLMDSRKHARLTGDKARISREVGGKIMAYDGYVEGTNLEIVPNTKIVQCWRGSDWPEGHYSKATFALAKTKAGTRLTFTQSGVPNEQVEPIKEGWKEHYWEKMKAFLEKSK
jgi:activator of HSP90 ATPase